MRSRDGWEIGSPYFVVMVEQQFQWPEEGGSSDRDREATD